MKKLIFCHVEIGYPLCTLHYDIGGTQLRKHINVANLGAAEFHRASLSVIQHLVAHVGLAYIPHLFALDDFDVVDVRPVGLSDAGVEFYETYLQHGLAELRLLNGLDVAKRVNVKVKAGAPRFRAGRYRPNRSALLLNGGGKDTAIAGELLGNIGLPFVWLTLGKTPAMERLVRLSGNRSAITLNVGGSLATIQAKTRYRGHKPFSSLLAFLGLLAAFVRRHRYIVVANEYSSNFGNVLSAGLEVNHQYPKSHAFEKLFTTYVNFDILPEVRYFSVLRPLYEIQIAKLFSGHPKYLDSFRSCNVGHRADYWCLDCPKCAFVLLALAPHLNQSQLRMIFGANPFAHPRIQRLIVRLCGPNKPFECVGTQRESMVALWMSHRRHPQNRFLDSLCEICCGGADMDALETEHMGTIERPHSIPSELADLVMPYFADRLGLESPRSSSRRGYARSA